MRRRWFVVTSLAAACTRRMNETIRLFDGTLDGWEHVGEGRFVLESGMLRTEGGMGLLWFTRRTFGRGMLRVVYKTENARSNSGVFVRIPERPTEPWMPVNRGYEVQILDEADDDFHRTGALYSFTRARARAGKPGDWNTLEIELHDARTVVRLNGTLVTDHREGDAVPEKKQWYEPERGPRAAEGYVGLQNHGADAIVRFREVTFTPL